jgi:hypothetical protein
VIEPTDEMNIAYWTAVNNATRTRSSTTPHLEGLRAVLALVERDYRIEPRPPWDRGQAGPCSEVLPPLLGSSASTWCELPHGHTGDHENGPTRWKAIQEPEEAPRWRCNRTSRCIREAGHTGPHAFTGLDPQ